jgi:hypothetical protein
MKIDKKSIINRWKSQQNWQAIDYSLISNINRLINIDWYWLISILIDYLFHRLSTPGNYWFVIFCRYGHCLWWSHCSQIGFKVFLLEFNALKLTERFTIIKLANITTLLYYFSYSVFGTLRAKSSRISSRHGTEKRERLCRTCVHSLWSRHSKNLDNEA